MGSWVWVLVAGVPVGVLGISVGVLGIPVGVLGIPVGVLVSVAILSVGTADCVVAVDVVIMDVVITATVKKVWKM